MVVIAVTHVSAPYSSKDFTLELNGRTFVYNDNIIELQMFLSCIKYSSRLANPSFKIRVCANLLVNCTTPVREDIGPFNFFPFQCDWLSAGCIYLEHLSLAFRQIREEMASSSLVFLLLDQLMAVGQHCQIAGVSLPVASIVFTGFHIIV